MKILFMGTPDFAAASLTALLDAGHRVTAAVTRPDAAAGRGLKVRPSAVKLLAGRCGIPIWQPESIKDAAFLDQVRSVASDIVVVVAFGRILPSALLEAAPMGAINVHASLLPKYRGAAPVAWAIARGERETGVTTMRMIQRLDAGDILLQRATPIGAQESAGQLEARLSGIGALLLVETLEGLRNGAIVARSQDEAVVCYAPALKKADAMVDWSCRAEQIAWRVRAFDPHPVAHTRTQAPRGVTLRIWKARPAQAEALPGDAAPGTVLGTTREGSGAGGVLIACGEATALLLLEVQPEGRRRMGALEAVSGRHLKEGDRLGGS
jgi:methionyl-tRNA formyltransferase